LHPCLEGHLHEQSLVFYHHLLGWAKHRISSSIHVLKYFLTFGFHDVSQFCEFQMVLGTFAKNTNTRIGAIP